MKITVSAVKLCNERQENGAEVLAHLDVTIDGALHLNHCGLIRGEGGRVFMSAYRPPRIARTPAQWKRDSQFAEQINEAGIAAYRAMTGEDPRSTDRVSVVGVADRQQPSGSFPAPAHAGP